MSMEADIGAKCAAEDVKRFTSKLIGQTGNMAVVDVLAKVIEKCDEIIKAADSGYYP